MVIEKLSSKNMHEFNILLNEANTTTKFRMDFYKVYDDKSFVYKYFLRNLVKLIKVENKYIGYIWSEIPSSKTVQIADMYIKEEYFNLFNAKLPMILKSNLVIYESLEDEYNLKLIKKLKMNRIRLTQLMKLDELGIKKRRTNAVFDPFVKGKDERLRCEIQNAIFKDDSRTPLTVEDIKFDIKQDYYMKDLCVFIRRNNKIIGYGQIIFNRGIYSIVNFGIIEKYRCQGYGEDLLIKLIELAKEKEIHDLYIRVDYNNIAAKKLYYNVGFKDVGKFSSWLWALDLIR